MRSLLNLPAITLAVLFMTISGPALAEEFQVRTLHGVALGAPLEDALDAMEKAGFEVQTYGADDADYYSITASKYEDEPEFQRIYDFAGEGKEIEIVVVHGPDEDASEYRVLQIRRFVDFFDEPVRPTMRDVSADFRERAGVSEASCIGNKGGVQIVIYGMNENWEVQKFDRDECRGLNLRSLRTDLRYAAFTQAAWIDEDATLARDFTMVIVDQELMRMATSIHAGTYGQSVPTLGDF